MAKFIKLTNAITFKDLVINRNEILLFEEKPERDGGLVTLYLTHNKEVPVSESLDEITDMLID